MSNTRHLNYQSIHKEEKRMKFELTEQSVQFTFGNKRYKNGLATKSYANVKKETPADKKKQFTESKSIRALLEWTIKRSMSLTATLRSTKRKSRIRS